MTNLPISIKKEGNRYSNNDANNHMGTQLLIQTNKLNNYGVIRMKNEDGESKNETVDPRLVFYINMHLLDKKEVIKSAVKSSRFVPKWLHGFASSIGANVLSDEEIVKEITDEIIQTFPAELEESGVTTNFELSFSKGIMAVLKCKVMDLDIRKVLEVEMGPESLTQFQNILDAMKYFQLDEEEVQLLVKEIEEEVLNDFPSEIETEMIQEFEKDGISCEVVCKREEEEANFLFDYMKKHM